METPTEKPAQAGSHLPSVGEEQCHRVVVIALAYAHRNGIRGEDGEDHARDFLLHLLEYLRDHPLADLSLVLSPAWLARSADNWMKNCLRARARRRRREAAWSEPNEDDLPGSTPLAEDSLPDVSALREEFHARVRAGVALLTPSHQALFDCYVEHGDSASEVAHASGRTANAVRQAVWAMRRHLRQILSEAGFDEAEVRDYLRAFRQFSRPD
ncbi:MAG: hypothetical protein JWN14_356 [Chthonomonadales bacterium]|nr:hypothetical protein [Chthonomonadales bacterium]